MEHVVLKASRISYKIILCAFVLLSSLVAVYYSYQLYSDRIEKAICIERGFSWVKSGKGNYCVESALFSVK